MRYLARFPRQISQHDETSSFSGLATSDTFESQKLKIFGTSDATPRSLQLYYILDTLSTEMEDLCYLPLGTGRVVVSSS